MKILEIIFWIAFIYLICLVRILSPKEDCIWLGITEALWNYDFSMVWVQKYLANIKIIQNFFDWVFPETISSKVIVSPHCSSKC